MDSQVLTEVRRLFAPEEGALAAARSRTPAKVDPPSPELGSLLSWAASTCAAGTAVEIGSAGGVSGLWLLRGMAGDGVLTSIEPDTHAHELATKAYAEASATTRVRAILGQPDEVLPRLSDGAYDLVLLQASGAASPANLDHARRLLRPGGLLIIRGALRPGEQADTLAQLLEELAEDRAFTSVVLGVDDGLALATRSSDLS